MAWASTYIDRRDPARLVKTMTSGVSAAPKTDMWQYGLGIGAEAVPQFAEEENADLLEARERFGQGGIYRTPEGTITNVNLGGEQVLPERFGSGGSFQTFTAGLGKPSEGGSSLPDDIRPELLITKERPEDIDRQLKMLKGQEQDLLRQRYSSRYRGLGTGGIESKIQEVKNQIRSLEQGKDLVGDQRKEQETLRKRIQDFNERGVGDRDEIIQDYNEAMARIGVPYSERLKLAKQEVEARPAPVDVTKTPEGLQYKEEMANLREQIKGQYGLEEKVLERMDRGTLSAEDYGKLWTAVAKTWDDPMKMIQDPNNPEETRLPTPSEKQLLIASEVNQILNSYQQRFGFGGGPGLGRGPDAGAGGGISIEGKGVVNRASLPALNPNDTASIQEYGNALWAQNPWLSEDELKENIAKELKKTSGKDKQVAGGIRQPKQEEAAPAEQTPSPDEMGIMNPQLAGGAGLSPYEKAYPETGRGIGPAMDVIRPAMRSVRGALGGGGFLGGRQITEPAQALEMLKETHGDEIANEFWRKWQEVSANRAWDAPPAEDEIRKILEGMGVYL